MPQERVLDDTARNSVRAGIALSERGPKGKGKTRQGVAKPKVVSSFPSYGTLPLSALIRKIFWSQGKSLRQ